MVEKSNERLKNQRENVPVHSRAQILMWPPEGLHPSGWEPTLKRAIALPGSGLGSVLPDGSGSSLCVLYLRDGTKRLGVSGAPHRDGVLFLLRHRPLEDRSGLNTAKTRETGKSLWANHNIKLAWVSHCAFFFWIYIYLFQFSQICVFQNITSRDSTTYLL